MSLYDLKSIFPLSWLILTRTPTKEIGYEPGTIRFCSNCRVPFPQRVSSLCPTLRWRSKHSAIFLLGPIPRDGLCSTHLSGEPSRHRSLPGGARQEALPFGVPRTGQTVHPGRRQRKTRLENLCGLCTDT